MRPERQVHLAPRLEEAVHELKGLITAQALSNFLCLCEVFGRGAPEEQAARDASHGNRGAELRGHTEEAVFHGGRAYPLRKREAGRGAVE
jgi:hypothetical protein